MMADYSYNQVTPELIEAFKKIVPGKVFTGDEINADYSHDEANLWKRSTDGTGRGYYNGGRCSNRKAVL